MKKRCSLLLLCALLISALIPVQAFAADPLKIEVTGMPRYLNVGDDVPTPEDIDIIIGGKSYRKWMQYVVMNPISGSEYDAANYLEGGKITKAGDYVINIALNHVTLKVYGVDSVAINGTPATEYGGNVKILDGNFWSGYRLDADLDDYVAGEIRSAKENGKIYVANKVAYDGVLEIKCFIKVGAAGTAKYPFTDVSKNDYFGAAVEWAYNHEPQITDGTGPVTFSPGSKCNRGQVVTFLWRAAGCPEPAGSENPFEDVTENDWFYKPVLWAVEKGITEGTSPTTFNPKAICLNSHILTFIWRAMGKSGETGEGAWWQDALNWAESQGMLDGSYSEEFDINAECPRANTVYYLWKMEN